MTTRRSPHRLAPRAILGLVSLALASACIRAPDSASSREEPTALAVTLELRHTFGSTGPSSTAQPLGRVTGLDVDAQGKVYVADAMENAIRIFGPDGSLQSTIGRKGEGPGEFSHLSDVFVTGTSVWALERAAAIRLTRFTLGGDVIETASWPFGSKVFTSPTRVGHRILVRSVQASRDADPELVVLADDDGPRWDVLAIGSHLPQAGTPQDLPSLRAAFLADGGWVIGWPDALRLWYYAADGTLAWTAEYPVTPRPVTDRDRAHVVEGLRQQFEKNRLPPELFARIEERLTFPEFVPVLDLIVEGPNATVWAQRNAGVLREIPLDGEASDPEWYVFGATGAFLGATRLPSGFTPVLSKGDLWYGTVVGENDVEYVAAYRMTLP